jgi:hypothetical protein
MSGVSFNSYTQQPSFQGLFRKNSQPEKADCKDLENYVDKLAGNRVDAYDEENFHKATQPFIERIKNKPVKANIEGIRNGYGDLDSILTDAKIQIGKEKFSATLEEVKLDNKMYPAYLHISSLDSGLEQLTYGDIDADINSDYDYLDDPVGGPMKYVSPKGQIYETYEENPIVKENMVDKFVKAIKDARENPDKNNAAENSSVEAERANRRNIFAQNAIKIFDKKELTPEERDLN